MLHLPLWVERVRSDLVNIHTELGMLRVRDYWTVAGLPQTISARHEAPSDFYARDDNVFWSRVPVCFGVWSKVDAESMGHVRRTRKRPARSRSLRKVMCLSPSTCRHSAWVVSICGGGKPGFACNSMSFFELGPDAARPPGLNAGQKEKGVTSLLCPGSPQRS